MLLVGGNGLPGRPARNNHQKTRPLVLNPYLWAVLAARWVQWAGRSQPASSSIHRCHRGGAGIGLAIVEHPF